MSRRNSMVLTRAYWASSSAPVCSGFSSITAIAISAMAMLAAATMNARPNAWAAPAPATASPGDGPA